MELPTIHCCNMLTSENQTLSKKYHKLAKRYKILEKRFYELKDQLMQDQVAKEKLILLDSQFHKSAGNALAKENQEKTRNSKPAIPMGKKPPSVSVIAQQKSQANEDKTNKILVMHNKLIKKYEKEMKINTSRIEQITKLALEKSDLQQQLRDKMESIGELQRQLETKERLQKCQKVKNRLTPELSELKIKLSSAEAERNVLRKENSKLKDELSCLDKGFFDEVEDLKYALQKSARLNTEYEKALKKICTQFGVDYKPFIKDQERKMKRRSRNREFIS